MKPIAFLTFFLLFGFSDVKSSVEKPIEVPIDVPLPNVQVLIDYVTLEVDRVTAYNPVPEQTWGDPNVSSCGPNVERQIAVSRDLFFDENGRKHLCGTRVTLITDRGEVFEDYVIWDTMNPRFTNTADIMFPETNPSNALNFGVTKGILIFHNH
jgi:3D (Asp-Asp-Asp) domain-containing protein